MYWQLPFDLNAMIGAWQATSIRALSVLSALFVVGADLQLQGCRQELRLDLGPVPRLAV
jgi:hypothetical protein